MFDLHSLLQPSWQAEQLLEPIWAVLTEKEKKEVHYRVAQVFDEDIPFHLDYEKTIYIHLFSLLTYLELSGLSGLVRCVPAMEQHRYYPQLRQQLVDEVVHAVLFMRMTYALCSPNLKPMNNESVKPILKHFVEEQHIPVILMMIYIVGETLVEELCYAMKAKGIAEKVFAVVLADESRHLSDCKLYKVLGPLDKAYIKKKLAAFEKDMIDSLFSQQQNIHPFLALLGKDSSLHLIQAFLSKYKSLLQGEGLETSAYWNGFISKLPLMAQVIHNPQQDTLQPVTPMRQLFSSLWQDPDHPTQLAQFSLNITPLNFFEAQYSSQRLTALMLQTMSKTFFDHAVLRKYYAYRKLYQANNAYIGLVVKLPGCNDKLANMVFKNAHEYSVDRINKLIQSNLKIMVYAYNKTEELKKKHPELAAMEQHLFQPAHQHAYPRLFTPTPMIVLSNVGRFGYEQGASPLFSQEIIKAVLFQVEKRQVWNKDSRSFEVQDRLPVSISVDHRVLDANIPLPSYMQTAFNQQWQQLQADGASHQSNEESDAVTTFIHFSNELLKDNLKMGFLFLLSSTFLWGDTSMSLIQEHRHLLKEYDSIDRY